MPQTNTPATTEKLNIGDPEKPETGKTEQKPLDLARCQQKTITQLRMMDNGVDALTALQLTNNKTNIAPITKYKLQEKYKRYSLLQPSMRKLAHNAVKDCLTDTPITQVKKDKQGNEIIEEIAPTWTNKLAAAAMVYDRVEPVVRQMQSINIDISAINLDDYRNGLACDMQGVSTHNTQVIDIKGE